MMNPILGNADPYSTFQIHPNYSTPCRKLPTGILLRVSQRFPELFLHMVMASRTSFPRKWKPLSRIQPNSCVRHSLHARTLRPRGYIRVGWCIGCIWPAAVEVYWFIETVVEHRRSSNFQGIVFCDDVGGRDTSCGPWFCNVDDEDSWVYDSVSYKNR